MNPKQNEVRIALPDWVTPWMEEIENLDTDEQKMRLAVDLARENVLRATGGPYGALVVERESGRVVGVGVNMVERLRNSTLHAEVVALMFAQVHRQSYTLRASNLPAHELITSCEPCAMCLGAAFWSGVRRIVCGAGRADAEELGFDEGPVFPHSYRYLEERGISVVQGVLADEAREVFKLYNQRGGLIYNP
jgi:tRNA(Arg) A34 adenosine deaminase TadA